MMKKCDIEQLERQGCFSGNWDQVSISEDNDLGKIRNVYFNGAVSIGANAEIINVLGGLSNVRIGNNVRIVNVARIENTRDATFGVGTDVAVLDETGGRSVRIYPGISAQIATIAARMPEYSKSSLLPLIDRHIEELPDLQEIGDNATILDCGPIINTRIWPGVTVEGASWLRNGSIVNNAKGNNILTYIGQGVNAEDFIIEDASVANGVTLRKTYVGQGSILDKGFTSHDSLFFANCMMENGEACAVLAGPYTVSMHKSSLLIGCQTAFMNAGSGTNMSNHMYKLGPVHWGILERGVKTSSNSYMMHGSRIGAFSLVMGEHKTHPDTSNLPFSYLFGDGKGNTTIVPGAMLKSYGLRRDEGKWPTRDRRKDYGIKTNDRIMYRTLNPNTVQVLLKAIDIIDKLLTVPADQDGNVTYKGIKINSRSLSKGRELYDFAINKYADSVLDGVTSASNGNLQEISGQWFDIGGQIIPEYRLKEALKAESISDMEAVFDNAAEKFKHDEETWAKFLLKQQAISENTCVAKASSLDAMVDKDRLNSLDQIAKENDMMELK